jgi:hypothetical protein
MVLGSFGRNERFKGECIELLEGTLYAFILKPMNTGIQYSSFQYYFVIILIILE